MNGPIMVRESTLRLYVRSIVVAAFFAASAVFSAQADTWVAKNTTIETIDIANEITSGDAERLQNISRDLEYGGLIVVRLNSAGGDVTAAMSIGRLIRKYNAFTIIPIGGKCYSSCALIFIAGVNRSNLGEYSAYIGHIFRLLRKAALP